MIYDEHFKIDEPFTISEGRHTLGKGRIEKVIQL